MPTTIPEAVHQRAAALGLVASEELGFCVLRRSGCSFAARGQAWAECFARLETAQPSPAPVARPDPDPEPEPMPEPEAGYLF